MDKRLPKLSRRSTVVILGALFATHLAAQWLKYPTPGVPRKADGKVDMSAPRLGWWTASPIFPASR